MGDANTALSTADARHLLRRAALGATPAAMEAIAGMTRGQAVDQLLVFGPRVFKPSGRYIEDVHNKWIKYMLKTRTPLQEKLVLFWHDHFATSNLKVSNPKTMGLQNRLLRAGCAGSFKDLVKAINRDAAMIEFLDTVRNRRDIPNENYARDCSSSSPSGSTTSPATPTTFRRTSSRSHGRSPAGATTTTPAARASMRSTTTSRRIFPSAVRR